MVPFFLSMHHNGIRSGSSFIGENIIVLTPKAIESPVISPLPNGFKDKPN